jgi:FkbM family methyltransferase
MKKARVANHTLWVTDYLAQWDAIAEDSPWEKPRFDSIITHMRPGDVFYEVGAEHGWMAAIYAQYIEASDMVLIEPSPELWPNIFRIWEANELARPLACVEAFVGKTSTGRPDSYGWPESIVGPECPDLAYRHLNHHADEIMTITIDDLVGWIGPAPKGISIDVEGAELQVIQGMTKTLKNDRPHVWISVHPDLMLKDFDSKPKQIEMELHRCGYRWEHLGTDHEQHWYATPLDWD